MDNLNRKTIIQIIIIIAAFSGSGFLIYNSMFKKIPAPSIPTQVLSDGSVSSLTGEKLLPYGKEFDLKKVLDKQNLVYGALAYPKLNFNQEVGRLANELISVSSQ